MKTIKRIIIILIFSAAVNSGCTHMTQCESIDRSHLYLIMDISDNRLFQEIERDLLNNFPRFMQATKLAEIDVCEEFTLSVAHLSGKEALELSSERIGIDQKGLSKKEERRRSNPAPLANLLKFKVSEFKELSQRADMTSGSNIANTIFKTLIQCDFECSNTILIFSDMVENNTEINFYRGIPHKENVSNEIFKVADPILVKTYKDLKAGGLDAKIIIVLKPEPSGKIKLREIRAFWQQFFKELAMEEQVVFIDNLTNPV